MRRLLVGVLAALLVLTGCSDAKKDAPTRLPDVTLPGLNGQPSVDLGTFKGPAVVNLWASWCDPCKDEMPLYAAFARRSAGKVTVLGVDYQDDKPERAIALAKSTGVGYPLVVDFDGELGPVPGLPKMVLIDAQGRIVHQEYVEITSVAQLEKLVAEHLGIEVA